MIPHKRQIYLDSARNCRAKAAACAAGRERDEWIRLAEEWESLAAGLEQGMQAAQDASEER